MDGKKLDFYFKIIKICTPFLLIGLGFALYVALYSNQFTDVGYQPQQPIAFSHKKHAGEVGISCFYCHGLAEKSSAAGIPSTQTCMNCHRFVKTDSPEIQKIHKSFENNEPIQWIRIHKLGDYVNFKHNVHIQAGISCTNCHGHIEQMEVVRQEKPLNMGFCLNCHRGESEIQWGTWHNKDIDKKWEKLKKSKGIDWLRSHRQNVGPENCSACHY